MKKRLRKLGAVPGGAAVSMGGVGGGTWGGSGGVPMPWWLCAPVGAVLVVLIVVIVMDVRDILRLEKANR
jgi:hypothetical protein